MIRPFLGAVSLLTCLGLGFTPAQGTSEEAYQVEEILGVRVGPRGIAFQVHSGGCTAKEDFDVRIMESFPLQLELVRMEPDLCEAYVPYGKTIRFSYRELRLGDGDQFIIVNPPAVIAVHRR
jgi:hypothetical protein